MMKKKVVLILVAIFLVISLSILVFATEKNSNSTTTLNVVSIDNTYTAINTDDISSLTVNKKEDIVNIANSYLQKFETEAKSIGINDDITIEYNHSGLQARNEIMLDTKDYAFTINADTGKLTNYSKHMFSFPKCELSREQIELIANEIFKKIDICNTDNYKMIYLEEYDEGIWWVCFAKKYDDLVNIGEYVKFHFIPETKEIWVLGTDNIKFDNNEVLISEETARKIASQYLEKSVATDMKVYLDIVNPNEFLYESPNENEIHVFAQYMRKAYVCEFNNEGKTQVYVDCSTGEILGGSLILGGEF